MSETYFLLKTVHILSATILFGLGLGTAVHLWLAHKSGDGRVIAEAVRRTVLVDRWATLPSAIVQPVSGIGLILLRGWPPWAAWLVASYVLFALAMALWLVVVVVQRRMRALAAEAVAGSGELPAGYFRLLRLWKALGWPALVALVTVFWLMVRKPL